MKTKTIDQLVPGESLLVEVKAVKGGKCQIKLASFANKAGVNIAALFNKGDERFSSGNKPRMAWQTAEIAMVKELFGIDCSTLAEGAVKEVNLLNPSIPTEEGKVQLFVQVLEYSQSEVEALIASKEEKGQKTDNLQYLLDNADKTAKLNPSTGEQVLVNGECVFSITRIVAGKPTHKWVNPVTIVETIEQKEAVVDFTKID